MSKQMRIYFVLCVLIFANFAYASPKPIQQQMSSKKTSVASKSTCANISSVKQQPLAKAESSDQTTNRVSDFMPVTAIVAIVLFIAREIFDFIKKYRQEKNKKKAISFLLAEELKMNYWSHVSLFRAYKQLADLFENYPNAVYRVRTSRFEKDIFEYKEEPDDKLWSGHPIPKFINEKYKSLLPNLAELDINSANLLETTYEQIAELEHFRQTLVLFLANEGDEDYRELTKAFIQDFTEEENDFYQTLNEGHVALVGEEMKEWRLR